MTYNLSAENLDFKALNSKIKDIVNRCPENAKIKLTGVCGHKYIGDGIKSDVNIKVYGVPGNDLGAFMDGPTIEVFENVQDGTGNTMNTGSIIIHGDAGDILGYSMRGGEIYVQKSVGYRSGIHMKSYRQKVPVIVIGGQAGNFLGEYMAGGIIILLGLFQKNNRSRKLILGSDEEIVGNYVGTGMHGGTIYIRGKVSDYKLGKEVKKMPLDDGDRELVQAHIKKYQAYFGYENSMDISSFTKLMPYSHRPYGKLYAY